MTDAIKDIADRIRSNVIGAPRGEPTDNPKPPPPDVQGQGQPKSEPPKPPPANDTEELPESLPSEEAARNAAYAKLRVKVKEKDKALSEAVAELARTKQALDAATREIQRLTETVTKVKLEESPAFRQKYVEPVERAKKRISDLAKLYGISEEKDLATLMTGDAKSRYEHAAKLFGAAGPLAVQAIDESLRAEQEMKDVLANWQKEAPKYVQDLREAEQKMEVEAVVAGIDQAAVEMASSSPYLKKSEMDPTWNAKVDALVEVAKRIVADRSPKTQAALALRAAMYDQAYSDLAAVIKERDALAQRLEELENSFPITRRGVGHSSPPKPASEGPTPMSPSDAVRNAVARIIEKRQKTS